MNEKFNSFVISNFISLVIMALSGLILNTVIAMCYGSNVLGIFTETYAWYMVLSQLSVWGLHMAIVKYVPETDVNKNKGSYLRTGILLTVIISGLITAMSEIILLFLDQANWQKSMRIAFVGLLMFSINKVLLNYLNSIYRMIPFAFFTSLRYGCLAILICVFAFFDLEYDYLSLSFPLTELIVFVGLACYYIKNVPIPGKIEKTMAYRMLFFGTRVLPSYLVVEIMTKVDIICLGAMLTDMRELGVYSFAMYFTEGFYMLYIVVRRIINPSLSEAYANGELKQQVHAMCDKLRNYFIVGGVTSYFLLMIGYSMICALFSNSEYIYGIVYLAIINIGIVMNGKSIVFGDLLAQAGFPFEESVLNTLTVLSNFFVNILLIFVFGAIGAATATAISYFVFSIYMNYRLKKKLGFSL